MDDDAKLNYIVHILRSKPELLDGIVEKLTPELTDDEANELSKNMISAVRMQSNQERKFNDPANAERGETLLNAISYACTHNWQLPWWVRREFRDRFWLYQDYKADNLEDAFQTEKRKHIPQKELIRRIEASVCIDIHRLRHAGRGYDRNLCEEVGEKYGVSGSTVERIIKNTVMMIPKKNHYHKVIKK